MPDDRLARALLRLYPHAWRARYGEEFLALVADAGLSWRAIADVIAAAGVERVRALIALARHDCGPAAVALSGPNRPFRDTLLDFGAFAVLVGVIVLALGAMGVPYPRYTWWFIGFSQTNSWHDRVAALERRSDRLTFWFFWFAASAALAALAWPAAATLGRLGVTVPSDGTFLAGFVFFFVCGGFRILYCGIRMCVYGSTWPGMHAREIYAWRIGLFMATLASAIVDPGGETFWSLAAIHWMTLRTPFWLTRAGAARRRELHDEMERRSFGGSSMGESSNTPR